MQPMSVTWLWDRAESEIPSASDFDNEPPFPSFAGDAGDNSSPTVLALFRSVTLAVFAGAYGFRI